MDKKELIKIVVFFTVSFLIILVGMTVGIGVFRPSPEIPSDSLNVAGGDSLTTDTTNAVSIFSDSSEGTVQYYKVIRDTADAETTLQKLDSLSNLVNTYQTETKNLEEKLQKEEAAKSAADNQVQNAKKMAKIYAQMPAEDAAVLISGLDLDLAAQILGRMKQRSAAKILAVMDKGSALKISKKIAKGN